MIPNDMNKNIPHISFVNERNVDNHMISQVTSCVTTILNKNGF